MCVFSWCLACRVTIVILTIRRVGMRWATHPRIIPSAFSAAALAFRVTQYCPVTSTWAATSAFATIPHSGARQGCPASLDLDRGPRRQTVSANDRQLRRRSRREELGTVLGDDEVLLVHHDAPLCLTVLPGCRVRNAGLEC